MVSSAFIFHFKGIQYTIYKYIKINRQVSIFLRGYLTFHTFLSNNTCIPSFDSRNSFLFFFFFLLSDCLSPFYSLLFTVNSVFVVASPSIYAYLFTILPFTFSSPQPKLSLHDAVLAFRLLHKVKSTIAHRQT